MTITGPKTRFDWGMLIAGLLLGAYCGYEFYFGVVSLRWPQVDAVVTESHLEWGYKGQASVRLRYEFPCGAQTCTGDRWRYKIMAGSPERLWNSNSSQDAEAAIASFPKGGHVPVAVSPGDPTTSVAEPGPSFDTGAGLVFALACVLAGVNFRRAPRPAAPALADDPRGPGPRILAGLARWVTYGAAVLLFLGALNLYRVAGGYWWPTVPGTVVYSHLSEGGALQSSVRGRVRYEYRVGDRRYTEDLYDLGPREVVAPWVHGLSPGTKVDVHVNPLWAGDSALHGDLGWRDLIAPIVGAALLAFAALVRSAARSLGLRERRTSADPNAVTPER
jgi:hypothetical protein